MQYYINKIIKTPTSLTILVSFLLLFWHYFINNLTIDFQNVFFVFIMFTTGIPHGALDHLVQKQVDLNNNKQFNIVFFLAKYLILMLIYGMLWVYSPILSFSIFMIISAWHFGETDLLNVPKDKLIWTFVSIIYGLYLLGFIFLIHLNEASDIIKYMLNDEAKIDSFLLFLQNNKKSILYLFGLSFSTLFIIAQSTFKVQFDAFRIFRLVIILICTVYLPLVPAFAIYFGGWHALCAFDQIHVHLNKNSLPVSYFAIIVNAIPFSGLAICFLYLFYKFSPLYLNINNSFAILFIFISLITLPHLVIFRKIS